MLFGDLGSLWSPPPLPPKEKKNKYEGAVSPGVQLTVFIVSNVGCRKTSCFFFLLLFFFFPAVLLRSHPLAPSFGS